MREKRWLIILIGFCAIASYAQTAIEYGVVTSNSSSVAAGTKSPAGKAFTKLSQKLDGSTQSPTPAPVATNVPKSSGGDQQNAEAPKPSDGPDLSITISGRGVLTSPGEPSKTPPSQPSDSKQPKRVISVDLK